ncbi:MAG: methionine--tRNA ligase [Buchnera aphidicola (Eriosoma harunire)]
MSALKKKMLVTCALPYANGPIHIGHLLEHIQADIWVRYQRLRGHVVFFICADDTHGTAIMMKSNKLGISSEEMIKDILLEHINDFSSFDISHDNYYTTHSEENLFFLKKFFAVFKNKKLIIEKKIDQLYDPVKNIFLPDRFIKGQCPICHISDQYGDNCNSCGSIYNSIELLNPRSILSGAHPILRSSVHLFFDVPHFKNMLYTWIYSGVLDHQVINKVKEWFVTGLKEWDISRDGPYFGFEIPNYNNKYFYVWLDAPIGYISSFKNFCFKNKKICFEDFWKIDSDAHLYHFIGKDIVYFHSLFWPAILDSVEWRKPTKIFVHGYVTIKGLKLSKSQGSAILAKDWIKYCDSDSLRYYYASKLSSNMNDIEIDGKELILKVNADIVNKVINLASRTAVIINKYFNSILSSKIDDMNLYENFVSYTEHISFNLEHREYSKAIRNIMKYADLGNQYINFRKPWMLLKTKKNIEEVQDICSMGINLFRIIMVWLKPIVPNLARNTELFLRTELLWKTIHVPLLSHEIAVFQPLYQRLDWGVIQNIFHNF